MKSGVVLFSFFFVLFIQISLVDAGYINVSGCRGYVSGGSFVCYDNPSKVSQVCSCSERSGQDFSIISCALTGFSRQNYCGLEIEGNYSILATSACNSLIASSPTYRSAFNISWDSNIDDCVCKVGTGKWNIAGNYTRSCCGDDSGETYFAIDDSRNKNKSVSFCCANPAHYPIGAYCCNETSSMVSERNRSCDGNFSACCPDPSHFARLKGTCVPVCYEINNTYWEDNSHLPISKVGLGATINLTAETIPEYFGSKNIDFTIYNSENQVVDSFPNIYQPSSVKTIRWKVPETGTYYFKTVSSDGVTEVSTSPVLDATDASFNLPSFANIYVPSQGQFFMVNTPISFSANGSYDRDDLITSTQWVLDDSKTSSQWEFQESYSTKGQKEIMLTVTGGEVSDGRDRVSRAFTSIMICDGPGTYVFVNISNPTYGERIDTSSYTFNSVGSYAKTCSDANCQVCVQESLDSFEWILFKLTSDGWEQIAVHNGASWDVNNLGGSVSRNKVRLTAGKSGSFESTEREFLVRHLDDVAQFECVEPSRSQWRDFDDDSLFSSLTDCYKEGVGTCCPSGSDCIEGVCQFSEAFFCMDYKTEAECNSFNLEVARNSVRDKREDSKSCPDVISSVGGCIYSLSNCSCYWNAELQQCAGKSEVSTSFCEESAPPVLGSCSYVENLMKDSCDDDGLLTYSWGANWDWDNSNPTQIGEEYSLECIGGSRSIVCPSKINLSFFGGMGLFLSVLLIVLFYFFYRRK